MVNKTTFITQGMKVSGDDDCWSAQQDNIKIIDNSPVHAQNYLIKCESDIDTSNSNFAVNTLKQDAQAI